jgi:hypothetical protein
LRETDDWTKQHLDVQCSEYVGLYNLYDTKRTVSGFLAACESTLNELPEDPGGPDKNLLGLYIYIASLASIYEDASREKPCVYHSDYDGWHGEEFVYFVKTCLAEIGQPILPGEETALFERTRKALSPIFIQAIIYGV